MRGGTAVWICLDTASARIVSSSVGEDGGVGEARVEDGEGDCEDDVSETGGGWMVVLDSDGAGWFGLALRFSSRGIFKPEFCHYLFNLISQFC